MGVRANGLVRGAKALKRRGLLAGVAGLVGTAYHLIERARLGAYRAGVRRAQGALHPFRVHVTGPWAPYAFAPQAVS